MKIKLILGTILSLMLTIGVNAQQPAVHKKMIHHKKGHIVKANHKKNMTQATRFLNRTNRVIITASKTVKRGGVKKGNLAKAVYHQRYAKKLLANHKVHRAVQHSRVARKYAMLAINQNKSKVDQSWLINAEEKEVLGTTVSDADLENDLKQENPSLKYNDDSITDKELSELQVIEMNPTEYKNQ